VNQNIFKQRVKFEDWSVGLDYFDKGSYFTKFDLKSGYHHLESVPRRGFYQILRKTKILRNNMRWEIGQKTNP